MRSHVAERTLAPVDPAAPVEGVIDRVILDLGSDAEEQVPVEAIGYRPLIALHRRGDPRRHRAIVPASRPLIGRRGRPRHALRPEAERPVGPDVHLVDLANRAALDVFDRPAVLVARMPLVAL